MRDEGEAEVHDCTERGREDLRGSRKQTAENEQGVELVARGSKFILLEGCSA